MTEKTMMQACTVVMALLLPAAAAALRAQETSSLAASEVADLLGDWTLDMDMQGRPVQMILSLADVNGRVAASLQGGRRPEPTVVTRVSKTASGLKLEWQRDFGGQQTTLAMELAMSGDTLTGTFGDEGGFFSADVTGSRGAPGAGAPAAGEVAATDAEAAAEGGSADGGRPDQERARRRRRRGGESAELVLAGKKIHIAYADLDRESTDYRTLESLENGKVFQFVGGRAMKLLTDASLRFGEAVIERGNASPDYPGVYSLWLMKAADDEWHLVFNEDADIWGTQYLSEADAAHVPIRRGDAETESERLEVELVDVGENAGLLRIAWGPHEWLAPFALAPEPDE